MPKKMEESKKEELQAKYIQLQILKQQLSAYAEEKQAVDEKTSELTATVDVLHRMETMDKGGEIWSPIGSGSFVRSDIKDIEKVMIAIGAGVVVRETRERAIEIIQDRLDHISRINDELVKEMTKYVQAISQLEPEVEKLAHEQE